MKRNTTGSVLALALFISLFLTGNAFANTYSFVLEKDSDVINIYDMDGEVQKAKVDLSANPDSALLTAPDLSGDETEIITAMIVSRYGNFLYFVTEKIIDGSGQLYRLNIGLYLDDEAGSTQPFSTITPLTSVGKNPVDLVEGPSGYAIYVANSGDNSITKFDMNPLYATPVATTKDGFYAPAAIAVTKGHDVFVANSVKNGDDYVVSIYNTYKQVEIVVENKPTDIIITPDFEYVYVCNSPADSGLISVIKPEDYLDVDSDGDDIVDAGENTVVNSITISGATPKKLAFINGGDTILAIDSDSNILTEVDSIGRMNNIYEHIGDYTGYSGLSGTVGAQDGSKIYTVTGLINENVYVIDLNSDAKLADELTFIDTGEYQDIVIRSALPLPVADLEADVELGVTTLTWDDKSDNETGFLIYRFDHDDDTHEYKYYFLDKIGENSQTYQDTSVHKGKRYSYRVYPYNDFSRGVSTIEVTAKAKDTSDTEICFISGVTDSSDNAFAGLLTIALTIFTLSFFLRRKI